MTAQPTIHLVDVAATAREMFGDHADDIIRAGGHRDRLPDYDWRFELHFPNGAEATMHAGATAAHVAAYIERENNR